MLTLIAAVLTLAATPAPAETGPVWIAPAPPSVSRLRASFSAEMRLPTKPDRSILRVCGRDRYRVRINGAPVLAADQPWGETYSVSPAYLRAGENRIEVDVEAGAPRPGPDNAWVVLQRDLPAPIPVRQVRFETRGARRAEWLYVQLIDAEGRPSGYYCAEKGLRDLMLGADGAAAAHEFDAAAQERIPQSNDRVCDLSRIIAVQVRMDRKTANDPALGPAGEVAFPAFRLLGPRPADLSGPVGWRVLPGSGEHRGATVAADGAGFVVRYDFTPLPNACIAVDWMAFRAGRRIGRVVSGPAFRADSGIAAAVERPAEAEWSPPEILDEREPGIPPTTVTATLELAGGADRMAVGRRLSIRARLMALGTGPEAVEVRGESWSGREVFRARARVTWRGGLGEAVLAGPALRRGLYRFTVRLPGLAAPERSTAIAVLGAGQKRVSAIFDTLTPVRRRPGRQGVDLAYMDSPALLMGPRDLGVNFLQFHLGPEQIDNGELAELIALCRAIRVRFALNNETSNWAPEAKDPRGVDRFAHADGCHRWDIEAPALRAAAASGLFDGVVYDEGEHMQLSRNFYSRLPDAVRRAPYLAETTGMTLAQAHDALVDGARAVVAANRASGARTLVESVFPVLWHPLARAGFTLSPKLLKEDIHPVVLAGALGAARQYGADLWFSPDMWYLDRFPGHSVREYTAALRMAHAAGVDNVYSEFVTMFVRTVGPVYEITAHGAALRDHIARYLPAHPRAYTFRDVEPEVAIVTAPDGDWGQTSCSYWNNLYGALDLHSTPETREWMQVWNLLSGGAIRADAVNTNSGVYPRGSWISGQPSPPAAIYDHEVTPRALGSVERIVLCGTRVSPAGLAAVRARVRGGAVCVASARLCPADLRARAGVLPTRIADGRGAWVVVAGFTRAQVGRFGGLLAPRSPSLRLRFHPKGRSAIIVELPGR